MKKNLKIVILVFLILGLIGMGLVFGINSHVKSSTEANILELKEVKDKKYDAIIILGAGLSGDGPSPMLKERLDKGIEFYKAGIAKYIVMSGDHIKNDHDEVNVMKEYAIENGVESGNIFMDHAGISTYDSIIRAKEIFGLEKIMIVTQEYHLYRALYIARELGLDADGADATVTIYSGQLKREIREILARDKDYVKCILKRPSKTAGDEIPVQGSGNVTNDKPYVSIKDVTGKEVFYSKKSDVVNKVNEIIDNDTFSEETCDGEYSYELEMSIYHKYMIEIYDKEVHILMKEDEVIKEIVLDEENSNYIKNLLNISV